MGQNLPSVPPKKFHCSKFFEIFEKCCTRNAHNSENDFALASTVNKLQWW